MTVKLGSNTTVVVRTMALVELADEALGRRHDRRRADLAGGRDPVGARDGLVI